MICFGHAWVPVGADRGVKPNTAEATTVVHRRCDRCGALSTQQLDGHWTDGQLGIEEPALSPKRADA